jgi:hypothetical protein
LPMSHRGRAHGGRRLIRAHRPDARSRAAA